jgi:hypothetical protein
MAEHGELEIRFYITCILTTAFFRILHFVFLYNHLADMYSGASIFSNIMILFIFMHLYDYTMYSIDETNAK